MATDYSDSSFLKSIGAKNPRPVIHGTELIVECDDGVCVSREEALGTVSVLPEPDEILRKAKELREQREQNHGDVKGPKIHGLRECTVPYSNRGKTEY